MPSFGSSSFRATRPIVLRLLALVIAPLAATHARAQNASTDVVNRVSPALRIERRAVRPGPTTSPAVSRGDVRSIDGSGNNLSDPDLGRAGEQLLRLVPADYADGVSALAGPERASAREISNLVVAQEDSIPNSRRVSDFLWQWGQFVDHDLDLTDGVDPPEPADIAVPAGDPFFDPDATGTGTITFNRSIYDPATGADAEHPREQLNEITVWLDASQVYGSDGERAAALRTNDGTGRLRTSDGDLLPFNVDGLPNAGGSDPSLFLAGDVRANEQVGLTALHTLFVREHNRLADEIHARNPASEDERVYQAARRMVIAEVQVITYHEFLPALLGPDALPPYRGYDPGVDPRISNEFSAASYRFGHSAVSPTLLRLGADGGPIGSGHLALRDAFFSPGRVVDEGGIDPILRGLAGQVCQAVDAYVVDDLRNFLFGPPGAGGFDLASLNIQRGRDHGLPGYNDAREAFGLPRARNFADVTSDPALRAKLASAYDDVDAIDLWVGGLAEDPRPGAMVGELVGAVVAEQFAVLRDGDRFWYARTLSDADRARVESTRLADVIRRNTGIGSELADDVFRVR
jgi:peroxidase